MLSLKGPAAERFRWAEDRNGVVTLHHDRPPSAAGSDDPALKVGGQMPFAVFALVVMAVAAVCGGAVLLLPL